MWPKQDTNNSIANLVSIIIPTYNRGTLIGRAISSVLQQTYDHIEVICVDDQSTDNSAEVIGVFERQYPLKVRYVLNRLSKGVSGARNTGVAFARSEFIGFLDSDDRHKTHHVTAAIRALRRNPDVDWIFADFERWQGDMKIEPSVARTNQRNMEKLVSETRSDINIRSGNDLAVAHILYERSPGLGASLIRRSFCDQLSFDESLAMYEDWKYRFEAIKLGCRFGYINDVHLEVYIHDHNACATPIYDHTKVIKRCSEFEKLMNSLTTRTDISREERRALHKRAADEFFWDGGYSLYTNGYAKFAGPLMRKAITLYPWSPAYVKSYLLYLSRMIGQRSA